MTPHTKDNTRWHERLAIGWEFGWVGFGAGVCACYLWLERSHQGPLPLNHYLILVVGPAAVGIIAYLPRIILDVLHVFRTFRDSRRRFPTSLPLPASAAELPDPPSESGEK